MAKEFADPKTRSKHAPVTLKQQQEFADIVEPDQLIDVKDKQALEWKLAGVVDRRQTTITNVQSVKSWTSDADHKDPKSADLKTIKIDSFNVEPNVHAPDVKMLRFKDKSESDVIVYEVDCTERWQEDDSTEHGMGALAPHNRMHVYDTFILPLCLEEPDNTGGVHGKPMDVKDPSNYFGYVRRDSELTYQVKMAYNQWEIEDTKFKTLFGFSPENSPAVTHKKIVHADWKTDSMLSVSESMPYQGSHNYRELFQYHPLTSVVFSVGSNNDLHLRSEDTMHTPIPSSLVYDVEELLVYMMRAYKHPMSCSDGNPFKPLARAVLASEDPHVQLSVKKVFSHAGIQVHMPAPKASRSKVQEEEMYAYKQGLALLLEQQMIKFSAVLPDGAPFVRWFKKTSPIGDLYHDLYREFNFEGYKVYYLTTDGDEAVMAAPLPDVTVEEAIDLIQTGNHVTLTFEEQM